MIGQNTAHLTNEMIRSSVCNQRTNVFNYDIYVLLFDQVFENNSFPLGWRGVVIEVGRLLLELKRCSFS